MRQRDRSLTAGQDPLLAAQERQVVPNKGAHDTPYITGKIDEDRQQRPQLDHRD